MGEERKNDVPAAVGEEPTVPAQPKTSSSAGSDAQNSDWDWSEDLPEIDDRFDTSRVVVEPVASPDDGEGVTPQTGPNS